ncbi:glutamate synthase subunit beta [Hydrogenophilus thermoluteolus]|uniref:Glutamate synthase subunit beta n=1 Tax=Hydrogenophilus thermoluteolus TaxID=297 RepID=A0A2Z6E0S9_HYDTE|nr:glutamate synthase subunit beta [Hydrogenophilus thermoluteolus]BBD78082.1 glutamate synthase subunit beta [Hydrogenophilus thermoluteolus]
MGKPTGFLEFARISEAYEAPEVRVKSFKEFVHRLTDEQAKIQGARCMDCGIPFCNNGCPVNNLIPDWNDLVYRGKVREAVTVLHSTNNFPEFTGRICPAPCEAACTLNLDDNPVGIKSIERYIADTGWEHGWIVPEPAREKTGKQIAVVGSGPAGLACAQQLARAGHSVTVFEKSDRIGGLLRYGIPDFKLEKWQIDRRIAQMEAEGVVFRTRVRVGPPLPEAVNDDATESITPEELRAQFDAVVLAVGSEVPRDLDVPGRTLAGIHFAMKFLTPQNKAVAGDQPNPIDAKGKHVIVIGGGDTGADCTGTSLRQGALSVTQLELLPKPPEKEEKLVTWPYWPHKLRTSTSHEEGRVVREWAVMTKAFLGDEHGRVRAISLARLDWSSGKPVEIPDSEFELPADLVFLAMGFVHPAQELLDAFGIEKDARGNAAAATDGPNAYATNVPGVFVAGDCRRGQSLVVWAIREGRQCARAVDEALMGTSILPR